MTKMLAVTFALLGISSLCSAMSVPSYEGFKVLRVKVADRDAAARLHQVADDQGEFWSDLPGRHADIMVAPDRVDSFSKTLQDYEFEFSTMIENIADLMRLERVAPEAKKDSNAEPAMTWDSYHSYDEIVAYLNYLQTNHTDLVTLENIGKTFEKRDMFVVKICKGECGKKPAMWVDGGIHAREWITPAVVTYLLHRLLEDPHIDDADLLDKLDWYILPVVNPDGYEYTRTGDRLWRKTRSTSAGGLCKGADANRNYGPRFDVGGSSDSPCSDTYHGASAFSEIENMNIQNYLTPKKEQFKFFNTIHSFSQLILLPWGWTTDKPPTFDKIEAFAIKANEALFAVHKVPYEVGCIPCMLYVASGGSLDWALEALGIPYSMGMELRDTGRYGFLLPPEQIIPTGEEVWAFHKAAARQIIEEFVKP